MTVVQRTIGVTLLAALLASTAFAAPHARVDAGLQEAMKAAETGELIPVCVLMDRRPDSRWLERYLGELKGSERKRVAFEALRQRAEADQADLLAMLDTEAARGTADYARSLVLANAVSLEATPELIERIARRQDVYHVAHDPEVQVVEEPVRTQGTDDLDEIVWGVNHVEAPDVWTQGYTGSGVLLAILDTGVNYNHVDLADHLWDGGTDYPLHGYDFYNDDNDPMDDGDGSGGSGHGTHCAGTALGDGTAGSQTGVAPDATLMCLKVLSGTGTGSYTDYWAALDFALLHQVDVTSSSLGWRDLTGPVRGSFRESMDDLSAAGVHNFASAGNERGDPNHLIPHNVGTPGSIPSPWHHPDDLEEGERGGVLGIGATDAGDNIAGFSSPGPTTWQGVGPWYDWWYDGYTYFGLIKPDISGPGVNIKSTAWNNTNGYLSGWSGTSMSCPLVAGVAALMLSKDSTLAPTEVDSILQMTAVDEGPEGKDNDFGAGVVHALDAVNAVLDSSGFIEGFVTDGNNDDPIPFALITFEETDRYAVTNDTGWYRIELVPGEYTMNAVLAPYAPYQSGALTVLEDDTLGHSFTLDIGNLGVDPEQISVSVDAFDTEDVALNLSNSGGADVNVIFNSQPDSSEVVLLDSLFEADGSGPTGDTRMRGLVFVDSLFYVSGSNNGDNPNKIYVFNQEWELLDTLDQPSNSSVGFYDLAWDGTNLWGSDGNDLVAMDLEGNETNRFPGPYNPNRALAWDGASDVLWVGESYRDFIAYDIATEAPVDTLPSEIQTQALAYVPGDEDGFVIYALAHDNDGDRGLYRANPATDELFKLDNLPDFESRIVIGLTVAEGYQDSYIAAVGLLNTDDGDKFKGWQLDVLVPWLQLPGGPVTVGAGASQEVTVTIAPGDLPSGEYEGIIRLSHNTMIGETMIPVTLSVFNDAPEREALPTQFAMAPPWPNPFNAVTTVQVTVPRAGEVDLVVYDLLGRQVARLHQGALSVGVHDFSLDMHGMASGVYFLRMEAEGFSRVRKIALMK